MYQKKWKAAGAVITAMLFLALTGSRVDAAGQVTITSDKDTAVIGDVITVTVEADGSGDAALAPQISVEYDANRLSFMECDKEYGGGGGGLVTLTDTKADISFSVLSGGTAEVKASAATDGETATASVQISVEGEDTAAAASQSGQTETGVEAGTIMSADGTKVVSTVFADEFMPALFHKTTVTYEEQMVEAAQFDMGDIILLYVTDTTGNNGAFNVYNQATGALSDFRLIQGIENRFIIVLSADDTVTVPDGFTKATLQWNEQSLEAYMIAADSTATGEEDAAILSADVSSADFFLLYAMSSEGNKGWYLYDQAEGTYQRYLQVIRTTVDESGNVVSSPSASTDGAGSYKEQSNRRLLIICIMAAVMLIMFIVLLNLILKLRDYQSYDYIDEDEEDEEEAQPQPQQKEKGRQGRISASQLAEQEMNQNTPAAVPTSIPTPQNQVLEDEDEDLEIMDDYGENEEDLFKPRHKKEKKAKKEKKSHRNKDVLDEPQAIDWSELEHTMKESTEDDRRPRGSRVEDLPPMYRKSEPEIPEDSYVQQEPAMQEDSYVQQEPAMQEHNYVQQEPVTQPQLQQPRPQQPQLQQPQLQQPRPQQPQLQQLRPQQPQPQQTRPQAQQQQWAPQPQQQQQVPPYPQPQQRPQPQQDLDLDEDFEFEFINLDE